MKIFLELRHPAHVHQYKFFINEMKKRGHQIKVGAMDKEITIKLLENLGIEYDLIGINRKGLINKGLDILKIDKKVFEIAKSFSPDLFVGRASPSLAHVSTLLRKPYISFLDMDLNLLLRILFLPFTDTVLTPENFETDLGKKHIRIDSFKELGYLHPDHFEADPEVLKFLDVDEHEKFVVMRFVAFQAYHDVGISGFTDKSKERLVTEISKYARVFITSEARLPKNLQKYKLDIPVEMLHSAMSYASLYIGDSGTTATESACLGTPAIRLTAYVNTDKERANFIELEKNYKLLLNYGVQEQKEAIEKAIELIQAKNAKKEWIKKRDRMLDEKIDFTKFMIWFTENYPESKKLKYDFDEQRNHAHNT